MNKTQKYILNGVILSLSAIIIRAVSVSFNVYLTSKIGAEGMGLITLIMSVYGFFITLATSGINLAVTNLISASYAKNEPQGEQKRIMRGAITYALIFSVTASAVLFVGANGICRLILKDTRCVAPLRILALTLTPIALSSVINGYFSGRMQIRKNVAVSFTEQLVKISLSCIFLTVISKKNVEALATAVILSGALSEGISLVIYLIIYLNALKLVKNPSTRVYKKGFFINSALWHEQCSIPFSNQDTDSFTRVFSLAFPVAVGAYVRSALASVEHIAIPRGLSKSLSPSRALESYGILYGMVFPLLTFPSAILGAFSSLLIPELSSASAKGEKGRISRTVSGVMWLSLLFSLGVSGIFISFSYEIGIALYGSAESSEYIRLLAPLIPLMYLDSSVDAMLKGLNQQLYCMRVNIVDSAISIILILTLLPSLGIRGYIAVVFITELLNMSLSILRLLSITDTYPRILKWVIKPTLSVIIATLVTKLIFALPPFAVLTVIISKGFLIIKIVCASALYLILSRLMGAVSSSDIKKARKIMDLSTLRRDFP